MIATIAEIATITEKRGDLDRWDRSNSISAILAIELSTMSWAIEQHGKLSFFGKMFKQRQLFARKSNENMQNSGCFVNPTKIMKTSSKVFRAKLRINFTLPLENAEVQYFETQFRQNTNNFSIKTQSFWSGLRSTASFVVKTWHFRVVQCVVPSLQSLWALVTVFGDRSDYMETRRYIFTACNSCLQYDPVCYILRAL